VLVLADPSTAPASSAWTALPPLEAARQEAAGIRQYTPPPLFHLLAGEKATPAALLAALSAGATTPHLGVLHLAAHTVLVPQHPELSGIALAPEKGRAGAAEGILWLRDISSMQAPPLVVLSGCQTQGGSRLAGEALESLSQAFFFAGAHGVVASLWSVDDASTAELMRDFYRNLLEQHKSAPAALRAAELAMLRSGDDVSSWAPFVFTGVAQGRPAAQASAFMKASAR
jgi:CHAT domain-containing protein